MCTPIPCTSCDVIRLASVKPCAQCRWTQQCWTTTPNIVGCYTLRLFAHPDACCCANFETSQTFTLKTSNISFVLWTPRRGATMLDLFSQLFQHCWGLANVLHMVSKVLWVVSFPPCTAGTNIVGSCCIPLYSTRELLRSFARSLTKASTVLDCKTLLSEFWFFLAT